jgi:hypothetical protein
MAKRTTQAKPDAPIITVDVKQQVEDDTPVLALKVPANNGTLPWEITLKPAGWGLMEDAQAFGQKLDSESANEAAVVGEFLDKYVTGGKESVPFWLGTVVFKAVTDYVKRYQDAELGN